MNAILERITRTPCALTDGSEAPLAMRIRDLPDRQRPREKLLEFGAAALDSSELLALFISSGTRGRSAIEIGRELLARFGSISALGAMPVAELAKIHGLGPAKASKLAAAFELGHRAARESIRDCPLDSPERVHACFAPQLAHLAQEQVVVALVDVRLRHLATSVVSVGSVSESTAHPREILRPAVTRGAHGFILVHNHPSGDPAPSRADEQVTRRLVEAARLLQVGFFDHVIIGRPGEGRAPYFSFREAGIVS